jgi:hypothetical protein
MKKLARWKRWGWWMKWRYDPLLLYLSVQYVRLKQAALVSTWNNFSHNFPVIEESRHPR